MYAAAVKCIFFYVKNCSYTTCQPDFFVIATDLQL